MLLHLATLGGATHRSAVKTWRARRALYADYVGIFAVDGGHVVGQTYVKRIEYTFPEGTETVSAIASVGTRPDRARAGIARRVLEEVHSREREAGIRFATLWTNRSWGAHRLYERLGYRDVYAFPWATRGPRAAAAGSHRSKVIGPARTSELGALEELHRVESNGRVGFVRRPKGYLRTAAAVRAFDPAHDLLVARRGTRPVGYAVVQSSGTQAVCGEIVAKSVPVREALISEIERRHSGAVIAFQHTLVSDAEQRFRQLGYTILKAGWYTFMASSLGRPWSHSRAVRAFAARSHRFLCLSGDRF